MRETVVDKIVHFCSMYPQVDNVITPAILCEVIKCTDVDAELMVGADIQGDTTGGIELGNYSLNPLIALSPPAWAIQQYWNNRDDYEEMQRWSEFPIIGGLARSRMNQLAYDENRRYWNDYKRNTGINPRYPIRSGMYGNYASGIGEAFEATEAVMSLYGRSRSY